MSKTSPPSSVLNRRTIITYGFGDLGLNFYWQGAGFFLLYYYTDVVGISNTLAGIVYAIGGLVDAISDPAMGVLADRTQTRWGRYRPFLLVGAIPLGISFILLFSLPSLASPQWVVICAIITHIMFRLCYTFVSIPYGALGTRLSFNATDRTQIAGVRMIFGALGGVTIVFFATSFRNTMSDHSAFFWASALAGVLGAIIVYLTFKGTKEQRLSRPKNSNSIANGYNLIKIFPLVTKNKPFLILISSMFLLTIANMISIKTILYRFENILNAPVAGGLVITLMTAAPLIALPCWVWAYLKFDKKPAFIAGCICVIISLVLLYFIGDKALELTIAAYVCLAIGFSSFAVGFWSILPDTIDYGHWNTGTRMESGLVGLASAIQKIAIALAGLCIGVALDAFNYQAGQNPNAATLKSLHEFSILLPLALMILCILLFTHFSLPTQKHEKIIAEIKQQKPVVTAP